MFLSHYIQGNKQIMAETQAWQDQNKHVIDIPTYHSTKHIHIHHQKHKINACSYEYMPYLTYLIASQHRSINAWTFECVFMVKQRNH